MRRVTGHAIEFCAFQKTYGHAQPTAIFNQTLQSDVMALLRHSNPFERPPARFQRFGDGIDSIDIVHEYSVYRVNEFIIRSATFPYCHSERSEEPTYLSAALYCDQIA